MRSVMRNIWLWRLFAGPSRKRPFAAMSRCLLSKNRRNCRLVRTREFGPEHFNAPLNSLIEQGNPERPGGPLNAGRGVTKPVREILSFGLVGQISNVVV